MPAHPTLQPLLDAITALPAAPTEAQRLFHGRGGAFHGCEPWALDAYPPVFLLTSYQPATDDDLATIQSALAARWAELAPGEPLNLVFQHRDEVRATTQLLCGSVPDPHVVK